MTDWLVMGGDEPLAVFPTEVQAVNQVAVLRGWMDDYHRDNCEDVREYGVVEVHRMERHAPAPMRVWTMKSGAAYAYDELWWPWNVDGILSAEQIVAGKVVEWVPGMWRGTDKEAVEAAKWKAAR